MLTVGFLRLSARRSQPGGRPTDPSSHRSDATPAARRLQPDTSPSLGPITATRRGSCRRQQVRPLTGMGAAARPVPCHPRDQPLRSHHGRCRDDPGGGWPAAGQGRGGPVGIGRGAVVWTGDWSVDGPLTCEPGGHYLKMNQKPVHNSMRCLIPGSKSRGDAAGGAQRRKGGRRPSVARTVPQAQGQGHPIRSLAAFLFKFRS